MRLPGFAIDVVEGFRETWTYDDFEPYQKWMAKRVLRDRIVLLAAEMGLGKTAAVLKATYHLLARGEVTRVLVIAPKKVAEETWPEELYKWDFGRQMTFSVLVGPPEEREKARLERTQIHIVNFENIKWLWGRWGRRWPYDFLIFDEASRLKDARLRTQKTKKADGTYKTRRLSEYGAVVRVRPFFKRVVELTGTPSPNGLKDLFGPIFILDRGVRLGRTKTSFLERWFIEDTRRYKIEPREGAEAEIMNRISDVMVSLKRSDYRKDLPPVVVKDAWVTLPAPVLKEYKAFERTLYLRRYDIEAVSRGVLVGKLLQFANGSVYDHEKRPRKVHNGKIDELKRVVDSLEGANVMIAYCFKFDLVEIKKAYPKARVFGDSASDMKDWNAGRINKLLIHPASGGHGLNFQFGGHFQIWFGVTWNLEWYQQFNMRLPRPGQKEDHVFIYRILARDTYDVKQSRDLETKGMTQDRITDRVRAHIGKFGRVSA